MTPADRTTPGGSVDPAKPFVLACLDAEHVAASGVCRSCLTAALTAIVRDAAAAVCRACEEGVPLMPDLDHFHACDLPACPEKGAHIRHNGKIGYTLSCAAEDIWRKFPTALPNPEPAKGEEASE